MNHSKAAQCSGKAASDDGHTGTAHDLGLLRRVDTASTRPSGSTPKFTEVRIKIDP